MSAPLVPSPLDYIGCRSFVFYPPIRNGGPNSWIVGVGSWSEVQVINAKTGNELWVRRQYIGAVSDNQEALTVGVTHSIELVGAEIVPRCNRRVSVMPTPHFDSGPQGRRGPASVVSIRLEEEDRPTLRNNPLRVSVCVLFVAGLLALVASVR